MRSHLKSVKCSVSFTSIGPKSCYIGGQISNTSFFDSQATAFLMQGPNCLLKKFVGTRLLSKKICRGCSIKRLALKEICPRGNNKVIIYYLIS